MLLKNQELKKFLIATAIVVVSVCIIDKAVGILGNHSMRLIPDFSGHLAKDNFTMNRLTDVDVLIVGSSRASHHYDAQLLIDSINNYTQSSYSIYNAGIDGNFLNHNACRLESILDRYQPKLVIFEIGESELSESGGGIQSSISQMAPYYQLSKQAAAYLNRVDWKTRIQLQSAMYRFNNKPLRILSSFLIPSVANNGYDPLYGELTHHTVHENTTSAIALSTYSLQSLTQVFDKCKALGVILLITSSPRYQASDNNNRLARICHEADIPYIELYNEEIFNAHSEYFKDAAHLNDTGAKVFTAMMFERLKPFITQF